MTDHLQAIITVLSLVGFVHDAVTRFMGLIVVAMGFNLRCRACDHSCLNHSVPHWNTMYQTLSQ